MFPSNTNKFKLPPILPMQSMKKTTAGFCHTVPRKADTTGVTLPAIIGNSKYLVERPMWDNDRSTYKPKRPAPRPQNRGYRDNADVPVNSRKGLLLNRQKQQQTINRLDVLTDENKIKFLPDADNLFVKDGFGTNGDEWSISGSFSSISSFSSIASEEDEVPENNNYFSHVVSPTDYIFRPATRRPKNQSSALMLDGNDSTRKTKNKSSTLMLGGNDVARRNKNKSFALNLDGHQVVREAMYNTINKRIQMSKAKTTLKPKPLLTVDVKKVAKESNHSFKMPLSTIKGNKVMFAENPIPAARNGGKPMANVTIGKRPKTTKRARVIHK